MTRASSPFAIVAGLLLGACAASPDRPIPAPESPAPVASDVATPVTLSVFDRPAGWIAADGAATIDLGDGRVLWTFGDTLIGSLKPDGRAAEGCTMVNNTFALSTRAPDAMDFRWTRRTDGSHASWVQSPAQLGPADAAHWLWPTGGGIRVQRESGDHVVLFFSMLRKARAEGTPADVWNFALHGTATVTVLNPADPSGEWRTEVGPLVDRQAEIDAGERVRLISWGTAVVSDPDDAARCIVYGVDVTDVKNKRLVVARAPAATLERMDTWEFRTGAGWSPAEAESAPLGDQLMDEFSVHRQHLGGTDLYVLVYMEPHFGPRIMARTAERPDGPWGPPTPIYTCPEPSQDARTFVYSARAHPELGGGPESGELLVTYCVNSTDFWYMLSHATLYRPRFVRVPLNVLRHAQTP
jgi:hypothetical protein